jgi:hypothetical protein
MMIIRIYTHQWSITPRWMIMHSVLFVERDKTRKMHLTKLVWVQKWWSASFSNNGR